VFLIDRYDNDNGGQGFIDILREGKVQEPSLFMNKNCFRHTLVTFFHNIKNIQSESEVHWYRVCQELRNYDWQIKMIDFESLLTTAKVSSIFKAAGTIAKIG